MVSYKKFYREHAIIDANVIIDLHEVKALSLLDRVFAWDVIQACCFSLIKASTQEYWRYDITPTKIGHRLLHLYPDQ